MWIWSNKPFLIVEDNDLFRVGIESLEIRVRAIPPANVQLLEELINLGILAGNKIHERTLQDLY